MSRHILQRMAKGYSWEPQEWHLKLADLISPVAVLATFRAARVSDTRRGRGKMLWFDDRDQLLAARAFLKQLEAVFGCPVQVDGPAFTHRPRTVDIYQDNSRGHKR